MDQICILLTKCLTFVYGICSGDSTDMVRIDPSDRIGIKAFLIGYLPDIGTIPSLPVYTEDEEVYQLMRKKLMSDC